MASEKMMNARIQQKHDIEANWKQAVNFIPKAGEIIIYDPDDFHTYHRLKIGDGETPVNGLPFIDESIVLPSNKVTHGDHLLSNIINTYILSVDYSALAFDTTEIVVGSNTSSILGQAILGQMVLA